MQKWKSKDLKSKESEGSGGGHYFYCLFQVALARPAFKTRVNAVGLAARQAAAGANPLKSFKDQKLKNENTKDENKKVMPAVGI